MREASPSESEQVSVALLLERAYSDFEMRLLSIGATYVLWGSLVSTDDLVDRYFAARNESKLRDKRRRLTSDEQSRVEDISSRAEEALRYRDWAREERGQPILRESLVAYCTAFENALKDVAIAFALAAERGGSIELKFVVNPSYRRVIREVLKRWHLISRQRVDVSTAEAFFRDEVHGKNPDAVRWPLEDPGVCTAPRYCRAPVEAWKLVASAFALRNAVVHRGGRLNEQILLGDATFQPGDRLELTPPILSVVSSAFLGVLSPLDPVQF